MAADCLGTNLSDCDDFGTGGWSDRAWTQHRVSVDVNGLHMYYEVHGEGSPLAAARRDDEYRSELRRADPEPGHRASCHRCRDTGSWSDGQHRPSDHAGNLGRRRGGQATYQRLSSHPEHFNDFLATLSQSAADLQGWGSEEEQLAGIAAPILLVIGDRDFTTVEHGAVMLELLPDPAALLD